VSDTPDTGLPTAVVTEARRVSLAWIVPVLAIVFAAWLVVSAWRERGTMVTVMLPDGHGLKVGDAVRYRGIIVGTVEDVTLEADGSGVRVRAGLERGADHLARAGARFWVVRPRLRLTRIEGLETLVGPRYLAVAPTASPDAARQREFVGLADPPVVDGIEPDDLEIILAAPARGSLQPGAPVRYRQMRVGTVISVGLASDGSIVEARVHVQKAYRGLVRRNTRFWDAGGLKTDVGLSGMSVEVDSLEALLTGGVALATPPPDDAGGAVHTGHRFALHDKPEDEWLEWQPGVPVGSSLLPPGAALPKPLRATIGWRGGFIIKGTRTRRGWVLQTEDGLLGPADLLTPVEADRETASLEVAGRVVPLREAPAPVAEGIARLAIQVSGAVWPDASVRKASDPEDCIAVADPASAPLPLAASRLALDGGRWTIDAALSVDESWHGASVLSRSDGRLVGVLLVDDKAARVALLP
jgi:hypothetical protein